MNLSWLLPNHDIRLMGTIILPTCHGWPYLANLRSHRRPIGYGDNFVAISALR